MHPSSLYLHFHFVQLQMDMRLHALSMMVTGITDGACLAGVVADWVDRVG
jgi:hypothetical protein